MRLLPWTMVIAIFAGAGQPALAQSADPNVPAAPKPPPVEVTVDCTSSPERVTIRNNTRKPLKLKNVGSTWQARAGEPLKIRKTLKPGKSVAYTFGSGSGQGKRLTGSFIFDNDADREGVRVKTTRGNVKVLCQEGTNAPPAPTPEAIADESTDAEAVNGSSEPISLLATLPIKPEFEDGYERDLFEHWIDADGNGCDTRQEVLIAESLTPVEVGVGCSIEGGTWLSVTDGDTLTNPASLDINHVVPLKEAWASGARAWTPEQRRDFANDLSDDRTLQAVSSGVNRQQGERDPASWLPNDRDAACQFVADWVAIKAAWNLSVDQLEHDAVEATLEACS